MLQLPKNQIYIYRAWDYKEDSGFIDLKNPSSERTISIDKKVMNEFKKLILTMPENPYNLIFYRESSVKVITNEGANIHSVSKYLGHAIIQTTLDHYSHVLKEMGEHDELIAVNVYAQ